MGASFFSKILAAMVLLLLCMAGCVQADREPWSGTVLVFKHGKIAGNYALFRKLLDAFEAKNPGIKIHDETLPASTDEQHQFYSINLEGRSADFDVLSMDVIWVPEFARAGWLLDVSMLLSVEDKNDFFPGPLKAVTCAGKCYALPWYIDAGLLYYRKDLLEKYKLPPPATWPELVETARFITAKEPDVYGFLWQGKQYEGLVCNVLEYFWSNGGEIFDKGKLQITRPENRYALGFMWDLIIKYKITPPLVTTATEEPTRHIFGNGRALFLRNWPYAWNIFEQGDSSIRGRVGVAMLPAFPGKKAAATLGGWQLGINRHSRHPAAAKKFISFLVSPEAQKYLALSIGYKPARKSLYHDADLRREQPFIASLYDIFMQARPRPVTPYYMMMTQVLQPEFSAAITGIKTPEAALESAQKQITHILRGD
jgi:multiple sugar transport system substrate-binding protein